MSLSFAEQLKKITEEYDCPRIHKILTLFVIEMLKIRHHASYIAVSIFVIGHLMRLMIHAVRELDEEISSGLLMNATRLMYRAVTFPDLTDNEVEMIKKQCKEIIPLYEDTLEEFLCERLKASSEISDERILFRIDDYIVQTTVIESTKGYYDEDFTLLPTTAITDKELIDEIIKYYKSKNFSLFGRLSYGVVMNNEDDFRNIVFTNENGHIRVSTNSY